MAGFRKAHMRAFVYNLCHLCCNKMHAYALTETSQYVLDIETVLVIKIGDSRHEDYTSSMEFLQLDLDM